MEELAISETMPKADNITAARLVNSFTDHANLTYICDPYKCNPSNNKANARELVG